MENNIKTIIFDYGCVLSKPQDRTVFKKMADLVTDQNLSVFEYTYYRARTGYDQGLLTGKDYWKKILDEFKTPYSDDLAEKLISLDTSGWTIIDNEMMDFVSELKENNYRLTVLSNMPLEILEYLNSETDVFTIFDKAIFSCEHMLIKPDPEIYKKCLDLIECSASEVLFIDDRAENISAAENEGIRGIKYSGFSSLREEIKNILNI